MKLLTFGAAALCIFGSSVASAEVSVTIHDGLVTVVARDATVRQILAEWARVGQARIVNAERLAGGPTSIELTNVPEAQALDTLLRSAAGYVAAPRAAAAANLSTFDRVIVMPTSSAPRAAAVAPPAFQPPQFTPPPVADDDGAEERPQPAQGGAVPNQPRGPVFNTFPQPQAVNPQAGAPASPALPGGFPQGQIPQQQAPAQFPGSAPYGGGVAVPGMVVPTAQPTQQPGQSAPQAPQQPGQVRRPGGIED
jgi:hypothetical protein